MLKKSQKLKNQLFPSFWYQKVEKFKKLMQKNTFKKVNFFQFS